MRSRKHNFNALETALWASKVRDTDAAQEPAETVWDTMYPHAIEAALVKHDFRLLLLMLRDKRPVHPMLLPALADAIDARGRPKVAGRKPALTSVEARLIADQVQYLRRRSVSAENALASVAERTGQSVSVVKRAYEEMVPVYRRPVRIRRSL